MRHSLLDAVMLSGLILVDKPKGLTSHDVVTHLRRKFGIRRIGHTGTLDPMATGLMAVLLGRATRLAPYVTETAKAYDATVYLGVTTNTYDAEGEVVERASPEHVAAIIDLEVEAALSGFRGKINQTPPTFSAIKIDGERAYDLARRGEEVQIPSREVEIHTLSLTRFETPECDLVVLCSKGTYIRSIAHDLGIALGVGGHLCALRRTGVGPFSIDDAWPLNKILEATEQDVEGAVRPLRDVVPHLPIVHLDEARTQDVRHGKRFRLRDAPVGRCRALDPVGELVAIVDIDEEQTLRVVRGVPPA